MDTIFIRDLKIRGKHGVYERERAEGQEFVLDISFEFDTKKAAESGDLKDTVDYGPIRKAAKSVVEGESVYLLEKLADKVAQKILEDARISSVTVSIRKTEMYDDCTPGIRITRTRT
jgi:dihydroneopterin aldolase